MPPVTRSRTSGRVRNAPLVRNIASSRRSPSPVSESVIPKAKWADGPHKGGRRSRASRRRRADKLWERKASHHLIHLEAAPGGYMGIRSGKKLIEAFEKDYPDGFPSLCSAPEAGRLVAAADQAVTDQLLPMESVVISRFVELIKKEDRAVIQDLFDRMVAVGLKANCKEANENRSDTPAVHLGIWEKYGRKPRISADTWNGQNKKVKPLIQKLLSYISENVAPRMARILQLYYPQVWARQEITLARVKEQLAEELIEKPWLDFGGAFFAVAIKDGTSERYHLDSSDDPKGLAWVTGVGEWRGADLKVLETGTQFPVLAGDMLVGNMYQMVHSAGCMEGRRITLTFFTDGLLAKHSHNEVKSRC